LGILLGNSIPNYWTFNIFEGVSDDDVMRITAKCTDVEREKLLKFGRAIPCGLLPVIGAPGVGKTSALCVLAELQLAAGKTVLATASQNPAVENFMQRLKRELGPNADTDYLIIRLWSLGMEKLFCIRATSKTFLETIKEHSPSSRSAHLYNGEESLAGKVLMLCGLLPTQNKKLLAMRNSGAYNELIHECQRRLGGGIAEEEEVALMDNKEFQNTLKKVMTGILRQADLVGTTLTQCGSALGAIAVQSTDYCIVDECCAATEVEVLQAWKENTPVALGGDPRQLPPTVLVENVKNSNGDPYSCFMTQSKYTLAERLLFIGWPYWNLRTQLRICPGGWDMTCEVFYKDSPRYGRQTLADQEQ
jgi:hypothetical protein